MPGISTGRSPAGTRQPGLDRPGGCTQRTAGRIGPLSCYNFLHSFKGAPSARRAPGEWPGRWQGTRGHRVGDALTETGTTARTRAESWRGHCPAPGRRPCRAPSGGSLRARRRRQVGLPRFRRSAVPAVTLPRWSRLQRAWPVLRAWHPLTAQDHSQGRGKVRRTPRLRSGGKG